MLLMCTPGGFEGFVLEQTTPIAEPPSPPDMGRLMTLAAKYGIDIHGPLPEMPEDLPAAKHSGIGLKSLNYLWIDAFNRRDWETESSLRAENFLAFLSGSKEPLDNAGWSGFMAAFTTAFPDSRMSIESCIAEGDTAMS
jgi:hypothetical protein